MASTDRRPSAAFTATPDAPFPPLADVPGVSSMGGHSEVLLEDHSFDTESLRLAASGIALYRRTGGADMGWHLELPDGGVGPQSLHAPLEEGDTPPLRLTDVLQGRLRGLPVRLTATAETMRQSWSLLDDDGQTIAVVSDDAVEARSLRSDAPALSARVWRYELAPGAEAPADETAEALYATLAGESPGPHTLNPLLAAVEDAVFGPGAASAPPPSPVRDAFLAYYQANLAALLDLDPAVRINAPDAVHQMRVASRRLRSALSAFRETEPDPDHELREGLKWAGRALGRVRDTEVMRERLADMVAEEPSSLVVGPVAASIDGALASDLGEATSDLLEALSSERYFALLDALEALPGRVAAAPPDAEEPGAKAFLRRDTQRLRKAIRAAASLRGAAGADPALHEARKTAKRLRYTAEAAVPFGASPAGRVQKRAHKIQKVLGKHQDSIVTAQLLERLAEEAHSRGESSFSYGRLHALEQELAAAAEKKFYRLRRKLPKKLVG